MSTRTVVEEITEEEWMPFAYSFSEWVGTHPNMTTSDDSILEVTDVGLLRIEGSGGDGNSWTETVAVSNDYSGIADIAKAYCRNWFVEPGPVLLMKSFQLVYHLCNEALEKKQIVRSKHYMGHMATDEAGNEVVLEVQVVPLLSERHVFERTSNLHKSLQDGVL